MPNTFRTGIGQSLRRFLPDETRKPCVLGGIRIDDIPGIQADWDGDSIFESIIQAIASLVGQPLFKLILSEFFERDGITDSEVYLQQAFIALGKQKIVHVAITIEGNQPQIQEALDSIQKNIEHILELMQGQVGITCCPGDGLTDCSCGNGLHVITIVTTKEI